MAESLNAEQIAERRTNLRAFRAMLFMRDDSELTTTLLMQEEWLATVDELQGYARDAHTFRGLRTRKCLHASWLRRHGLTEPVDECKDVRKHADEYCAPCYLRAIHEPDLPAEEEEEADTDELLRRHWRSEAFDPEGEDVTEGWPEEKAWREHFEAQPLRDIAEEMGLYYFNMDAEPQGARPLLHNLSHPEDPRDATPEEDAETARISMANVKNQMECGTLGHIWVKLGKAGLGDHGLSAVDWGDAQCLRCRIPVPVPDFDEDDDEEFFTRL